MKKYLREEEYNQVINIGKIDNLAKANKLRQKLNMMGIDSYIDGNEFYISVEQDRNDPHYVDDIVNVARREYQNLNYGEQYKMAEGCSKSKKKSCLREEEYNQVISLGKVSNIETAKELKKRLDVMGIDCHLQNGEFYITVEQDRNDPHYVDDVTSLARAEYNRLFSEHNPLGSYKLAENEFKWVCNECVKLLMEGDKVNDVAFALVSSLIKKDAYKKIKTYFRDGDINVKTKFDMVIRKLCRSTQGNKKMIFNTISDAIDKLMNETCREPNMTEYDMFLAIRNNIDKYI